MAPLAGLVLLIVLGSATSATAQGTAMPIEIELASGSQREQAAASQLRRLLAAYDLGPLIFTTRVRIESQVIPHSHPVLTLNTRHIDDDDRQLATFIHEQLHWFAEQNTKSVSAVVVELRHLYSEVPVKGNQGGRNEYSTYLHLIICLLEFDALTRYLGRNHAREVISRMDIYLWIYDKILHDETLIRAIATRHGLSLPKG